MMKKAYFGVLALCAVFWWFILPFVEWFFYADYCESTAPKDMHVFMRQKCRTINDSSVDNLRLLVYDVFVTVCGFTKVLSQFPVITSFFAAFFGTYITFWEKERIKRLKDMGSKTFERFKKMIVSRDDHQPSEYVVMPPTI